MLELKLNKEELMSLIDKDKIAEHLAILINQKISEESLDYFNPLRDSIIKMIEDETKKIGNEWLELLDNKNEINEIIRNAIRDITKQELLDKLIK